MARRSGALVAATVGAAVALGAACSPFDATPTDTGPADASAMGDAASPDAATGDAGGSASDPCKNVALGTVFCEDFETEKPHFGFTDDYGSEVTTTARVAVAGRGQVLAYRTSTTSAISSGWLRFGPAAADANLTFNALELSMDVAVLSQVPDTGVIAALWTLEGTATPQVHGIASSARGRALGAWMPGASGVPAKVQPAEWHTVKLRLQRNGGTGKLKRIAYVDGVVVDNSDVTVTETSWDLRIGFYYGAPGVAELFMDNVVVTRQ